MSVVVSVVGPTASGKTALSVALAKWLEAEVVSVDSMQIYRGMNIGTAKVTTEEQCNIPHHMIDVLSPSENCSVQKFITLARNAVEDICSRGKNCVLAGGTGLYVDHLITDTKFVDVPADQTLRDQLNALPNDRLWKKLETMDPLAYKRLHPNDKKRVVRALEVIMLTGQSITYWEAQSHLGSKPLPAIMIGLDYVDREQLYERINMRVDCMFDAGLVEEVAALKKIAGFVNSTAASGIGYKEVLAYLSGDLTLEETKELIQKNTRHYAKRQLTWFRRNPEIHWINITPQTSFESVILMAKEIIERNL